MGSTLQAQSWLTNGLVAYFPFKGNPNDASGNGYSGTNFGGILATNHYGQTNSGYNFQNAGWQSESLPLNLAGPYTFSLWINLEQYDYFCVIGQITDPEFDCNASPAIFQSNNDIYYNQCGSDTALIFYSAATSLVGGWHQFVATVDSSQNTYIYKDGVLAGSASGGWPTTAQANLTLGRSGNSGSQYSQVTIDSVRIYNRAFSSNEVVMLYAAENAGIPQFLQNLTNSYAVDGETATFSLTAASSLPISYQWYFVPTNNAGQAGAYAQTIGSFVYGAVVTNGGFGYGNIPAVTFVGGGGSGAAGYGTVSNGVVTGIIVTNAGAGYTSLPSVVIDPPNGLLLGETNSSLTISNANGSDVGNYSVVLSNAIGSVSSTVASLILLYPPSITVEPAGFTADYLSSNSLSLLVAGTSPLSYQWLLNGTNVSGATNSSYAIASLTLTNAGAYTVEVTNAYGSVVSTPAEVEVAPFLTSPFGGAIGVWGQNTVLDVGAVGSGSLSYQWYFDGVAIPSATNGTYALDDIQFTNAGLYSVVVSSAYGSVTNAAYQVVVNPANISLGICPMVSITGTVGYKYIIQSTADLADTNSWVTLTNIAIPYTPYVWADT
ncbi:MAG: hypothetical protein P4M10_03135, partial [Verrucomicrobiae bacterium]|nr:hypothetical protein [Verrucomicrobiae bacterium]